MKNENLINLDCEVVHRKHVTFDYNVIWRAIRCQYNQFHISHSEGFVQVWRTSLENVKDLLSCVSET